jgi:LPXTG-motif cell wall-anchored protein
LAAAFTSPGLAQGLRVEQAVAKPVVREVAAFEISGIGLAAQAANSSLPANTATAAPKPDTAASVALPVVPGGTENGMWIFLSGIAAILTAIAYASWRKRRRTV